MKYVLIGADGFVGRNLIERNNIPYKCYDNSFLHKKLSQDTIFLDITKDHNVLESYLEEAKSEFVLINLAAIHHIPYCNNNPHEAVLTNVYGNMKLFETAAQYGCKKFIFASSGAVYKPEIIPHRETDMVQSSDVYSSTKILAENYLESASQLYDIPVCILRFFNIVGKYDYTPHLVPDIADQIIDQNSINITLGNLDTFRDYISVENICDVVEQVALNTKSERFEVINIGSGKKSSGHEVLQLIQEITKTNKKKFIDKKRFRLSDRPVQVANTGKLLQKFEKIQFVDLENSLRSYLVWRGII